MDPVAFSKLISLIIIQIIAISGNLLMIVVGFKCKSFRSFQNAFIFNMAFADFFQGCVIMSTAVMNVYYGNWVLGDKMCKMFGILKVALTLSSVYSLSGISILRYFYIVRRTKLMNTMRSTVISMTAAWSICIFLGVTPLFNWGVLGFEDGKEVCTILFHITASHTLVVFITGLFLNVAVMMFCYICIFKTLYSSGKTVKENSSHIDHSPQLTACETSTSKFPKSSPVNHESIDTNLVDNDQTNQLENPNKNMYGVSKANVSTHGYVSDNEAIDCFTPNKNNNNNFGNAIKQISVLNYAMVPESVRRPTISIPKVTPKEMNLLKTICIIIIVFVTCWTPYVLFNIIRMFGGTSDINTADTITMWLGFINSAANPVIYGVMNRQFREAMKNVIFCL